MLLLSRLIMGQATTRRRSRPTPVGTTRRRIRPPWPTRPSSRGRAAKKRDRRSPSLPRLLRSCVRSAMGPSTSHFGQNVNLSKSHADPDSATIVWKFYQKINRLIDLSRQNGARGGSGRSVGEDVLFLPAEEIELRPRRQEGEGRGRQMRAAHAGQPAVELGAQAMEMQNVARGIGKLRLGEF